MGSLPSPCPICGREVPPRDGDPPNRAAPFCSPACKLIDLGKWLDGDYRLPGPPIESSLGASGERDE
jgi:uncharacterized protein